MLAPHSTTIAGDVNASEVKATVTFFPPLYIERQGWILDVLRQERVTSVLDVGCGEGALLRCLCNPAPFLLSPGHDSDAELSGSESNDAGNARTKLTSHALRRELHISRLTGLDVCKASLESCIGLLFPPNDSNTKDEVSHSSRFLLPRWEPLDVKLWLGSLEVYNPEFAGVECITASEVIEHLPDSVLESFAPVLLGLYRPKLLLITTPNYTFNARFSAPDPDECGKSDQQKPHAIRDGGYLDPTGRTTRVFRHADHKFEWTVDEFTTWCHETAREWGYSFDVDSVGLPTEDDPWGRDEQLGKATQVAVFRRIEDNDSMRPAASQSLGRITDDHARRRFGEQPCSHELLKVLHYAAHRQARKAQPKDTIQSLVCDYMQSYYFKEGYSIWDLWVSEEIAAASGGYMDIFVCALEDAVPSKFELERGSDDETKWIVRFSGERHRQAIEQSQGEKMLTAGKSFDQSWEQRLPDSPIEDASVSCNSWSTTWPSVSMDQQSQDSALIAHDIAWDSWNHEDPWESEGVLWDT